MSISALKETAFKLKGRLYTFTVMQLLTDNLEVFVDQLKLSIESAPRLFQQIPVVLDCTNLGEKPIDLAAICNVLRAHQVLPVAVQGANTWLATLAQCEGLAVMHGSAEQDREIQEKKVATPEVKDVKSNTKHHYSPVRSGQQVVARGTDLLIMGSVSEGAEVLSDGNIYIYGALRGRALAGISGNQQARIFCQSLKAELLSIGGMYRLNENMEAFSAPCQIYLEDSKIVIEPIVLAAS